jgi:hypothetical protein
MRGSSLVIEALEKKLLKALRRSLCRSCPIVPETLWKLIKNYRVKSSGCPRQDLLPLGPYDLIRSDSITWIEAQPKLSCCEFIAISFRGHTAI